MEVRLQEWQIWQISKTLTPELVKLSQLTMNKFKKVTMILINAKKMMK